MATCPKKSRHTQTNHDAALHLPLRVRAVHPDGECRLPRRPPPRALSWTTIPLWPWTPWNICWSAASTANSRRCSRRGHQQRSAAHNCGVVLSRFPVARRGVRDHIRRRRRGGGDRHRANEIFIDWTAYQYKMATATSEYVDVIALTSTSQAGSMPSWRSRTFRATPRSTLSCCRATRCRCATPRAATRNGSRRGSVVATCTPPPWVPRTSTRCAVCAPHQGAARTVFEDDARLRKGGVGTMRHAWRGSTLMTASGTCFTGGTTRPAPPSRSRRALCAPRPQSRRTPWRTTAGSSRRCWSGTFATWA